MNRLRWKFAQFMQGRNGTDRLNQALIIMLLISALIGNFAWRRSYLAVMVSSWQLLLVILIYYRMFSKNLSRRYAENARYLALENKVRRFFGSKKYIQQQRKEFHIYTCPECKQKIRIPKGKGKISVRCPKCQTEFIKRS